MHTRAPAPALLKRCSAPRSPIPGGLPAAGRPEARPASRARPSSLRAPGRTRSNPRPRPAERSGPSSARRLGPPGCRAREARAPGWQYTSGWQYTWGGRGSARGCRCEGSPWGAVGRRQTCRRRGAPANIGHHQRRRHFGRHMRRRGFGRNRRQRRFGGRPLALTAGTRGRPGLLSLVLLDHRSGC